MSFVPKKAANACIVALATVVAPEGCSGYGGVTSGGPTPPVDAASDGSNNGCQPGTATVPGFPSVSACWIAAHGRQNVQWYLSFHVLMIASAAVRSTIAN